MSDGISQDKEIYLLKQSLKATQDALERSEAQNKLLQIQIKTLQSENEMLLMEQNDNDDDNELVMVAEMEHDEEPSTTTTTTTTQEHEKPPPPLKNRVVRPENLNHPGITEGNCYDGVWNKHFLHLQRFGRREGHFRVPRNYDKVLCEWVSRQRRVLGGKKHGVMNKERRGALAHIGLGVSARDATAEPAVMSSDNSNRDGDLSKIESVNKHDNDKEAVLKGIPGNDRFAAQWNKSFREVCRYKEIHGHVRVPYKENKSLSSWLGYQRQVYHGRKKCKDGTPIKLHKSRFEALNSIGMDWGEKVGRLLGSADHGRETDSPRKAKDPPPIDRKRPIDVISGGNVPTTPPPEPKKKDDSKEWNNMLRRMKRFKSAKNHLNVTVYQDRALYVWMNRQRQLHQNGRLASDRESILKGMGWLPTIPI